MLGNLILLLLGITMGLLLGKFICTTQIHAGPMASEIGKQLYKCIKTGKYYKLIPSVHICPINISMKEDIK